MQILPVLLCGGSGTRLWPLSRKSYPKQFSCFFGGESLFQASALRLQSADFAAPLVITSNDYRFIVVEQLAALEIGANQILIEPQARNTAAAVCAAALCAYQSNPDQIMLVAPSDHSIPDGEKFRQSVLKAAQAATDGAMVTFGIVPDRPETGYGWLELETPEGLINNDEPQALQSFREKPDLARAQEMLNEGRFLWNAGIFLFSAKTMIQAFERLAPATLASVRAALNSATSDLSFTRLAAEPWATIEDVSIDYAIMEKADNLKVAMFDGSWSDLGDWQAVWREGSPDAQGNVTANTAVAIDSSNCLLHSDGQGQPLIGLGLEDIVAVSMKDAVLVTHKSKAQDVRQAVQVLKSMKLPQAEKLPRDFRPWGWYESLIEGARFQVKRIVVNPGESLSLQSHLHRSEHWIVVAGTARAIVNDQVHMITENESVYIPCGAVHRLENPGKIPMTLIEVQTGAYLAEDDIIRYEDKYARD